MFKYALDVAFPQKTGQSLWMYGGSAPNDDAAMKAAANEVRVWCYVHVSSSMTV